VTHDAYLEPYRASQRRHGSGFEVTLWASPRSQRRRFEVFAQMCFLAGKRILDAGCSRGDFAAYLLEQDIPFDRYVGVDALCEVIDHARHRQLPGCEFHCGDCVANPSLLSIGRPQVICISGTLNTMGDAQVMQLLTSAWQAAGETLLFNFLSDRASPQAVPQTGPARRLDTTKLLDWALTLTSQVGFRQDYFKHGHDATIIMRKD
jgi:SAM-dependent methyltransferase